MITLNNRNRINKKKLELDEELAREKEKLVAEV